MTERVATTLEWPPELAHAISGGRVTPFVGAGVSMTVVDEGTREPAFLGWMPFIERGIEELRRARRQEAAADAQMLLEKGKPLEASAVIKLKLPSEVWGRYLKSHFGRSEKTVRSDSLATARAVWGLGSRVVITTNYDDVLRWARRPEGNPMHWHGGHAAELGLFLRNGFEGEAVWHLHGSISELTSLVMTGDDYDKLYPDDVRRRNAAAIALQCLMVTRSLLFIGFSLTDLRFDNELTAISKAFEGWASPHYALLGDDGPGPPGSSDEAKRKAEYLAKRGVTAIYYAAPGGDHGGLLGHLESLGTHAERRTTGKRSTAVRHAHDQFFGRGDEIARVVDLLDRGECSAVVVTGPAGCGKTRLAAQLRARLPDRKRMAHADLTDVGTSKGLAYAAARALSVTLTGTEEPEETVTNLLAQRGPTVLVLDHIDELFTTTNGRVDAVRRVLRDWMGAPGVQLVITSRRAIDGVPGRPMELAPLPYPTLEEAETLSASELRDIESVALFDDRRAGHVPGFDVDAQLRCAARICARLNGLPLAIELVARHPCEDGLDFAAERIETLLGTPAATPARRRLGAPLDAALKHSVSSLERRERQALVELSVCSGGFDEAAAAAILGRYARDGDARETIMGRLTSLGLLDGEISSNYGPRWTILPAVRDWLRESRLEGAARWRGQARRRHREHYLRYGDDLAREVGGPAPGPALDRLELEVEDYVAIHLAALEKGDAVSAARACLVLAPVLRIRGPQRLLERYAEPAIAKLGDERRDLQAELLVALAEDAREAGDPMGACAHARRACDTADLEADDALRALGRRTLVAAQLGGLRATDETHRLVDSAEQLSGDDPAAKAQNSLLRGWLARSREDRDQALRCFEQAERDNDAGRRSALLACEIARQRGIVRNESGTDSGAAGLDFEQADQIAKEIGYPSGSWKIRMSKAINDDAPLSAFQGLASEARSRGNRYEEGIALLNLGEEYVAARMLGVRELEQAAAIFDDLRLPDYRASALSNLAQSELVRGDDSALSHAGTATELFEQAGVARHARGWLASGRLALAESRFGEPRAAARRARDLLRSDHATSEHRELIEMTRALEAIVAEDSARG